MSDIKKRVAQIDGETYQAFLDWLEAFKTVARNAVTVATETAAVALAIATEAVNSTPPGTFPEMLASGEEQVTAATVVADAFDAVGSQPEIGINLWELSHGVRRTKKVRSRQ